MSDEKNTVVIELNQGVTDLIKPDSKSIQGGRKSNNPAGRPPKSVSKSAEVKESYFRAYLAAGGFDRLVRLLKEQKLGKTKESRFKAEKADKLFLEFCFGVLTKLFPKQTSLEVEHRSITFVFGDGSKEVFSADVPKDQDVIDIKPKKGD